MNENTKNSIPVTGHLSKNIMDMNLDELAQLKLTPEILDALSESDLKILCQRLDAVDPEDLRAAIDRAKSKTAETVTGEHAYMDSMAYCDLAKTPEGWAKHTATMHPMLQHQMSIPDDAAFRTSLRENLFQRAQDEAAGTTVPYVTICDNSAAISDAGEPVEIDGDNQGDTSEQGGEEDSGELSEGIVYSSNTNGGHFDPGCEA